MKSCFLLSYLPLPKAKRSYISGNFSHFYRYSIRPAMVCENGQTQIILTITCSVMLNKDRGGGVMTQDNVRWKRLSASACMSRMLKSAKGVCLVLVSHGVLSMMKYIENYKLTHKCMFSHLLLSYTAVSCCSMWGDTVCLMDLQLTDKTLKPPPTPPHTHIHTGSKLPSVSKQHSVIDRELQGPEMCMSELVEPWKEGAQTPPEKLMLPVYCSSTEHMDHDSSHIQTSVGKIFHSDCQGCHKCLK